MKIRKKLFVVVVLILSFGFSSVTYASVNPALSEDSLRKSTVLLKGRNVETIKDSMEANKIILEDSASGTRYFSDMVVDEISETENGGLCVASHTDVTFANDTGKVLMPKENSLLEDMTKLVVNPVYADTVNQADSALRVRFTFTFNLNKVATASGAPWYGWSKWRLVSGSVGYTILDGTWIVQNPMNSFYMGQMAMQPYNVLEEKTYASCPFSTTKTTGFTQYISTGTSNSFIKEVINVTLKRTTSPTTATVSLQCFVLSVY